MQENQTRQRKPMHITVELTSYGMLQRALFKGKIKDIVYFVSRNPNIEYSKLAHALNTDRQTIACNIAYLVKKGYAKTTKRSGAIHK